MRNTLSQKGYATWQQWIICLWLVLCFGSAADAQAITTESLRAALKKPVHLIPEKAEEQKTLRTLLAQLNVQTGLHVDAEDYLLDRKVTIAADGQSAGNILKSLMELNDWTWRETEGNHILLTRPRYVAPTNLNEVPKALQRCLPLDLRRYLGIGAAPEDIVLPEDSRYYGREASVLKRSPELILSESAQNKMSVASQQVDDNMLQLLSKQHFQVGILAYEDWSQELRHEVFKRLVLAALKQEAKPASASLYLSALLPFQTDLSKAVVSVHGGIFIFSYHPHRQIIRTEFRRLALAWLFPKKIDACVS